MSVTPFQNDECYRVTRSWGNEERQFYFPFNVKGLKMAEKKDAELAVLQKAYKLQSELLINRLFWDDGSVRGLVLKTHTGNSGKVTETFKLQCSSNNKKYSTSASITRYGVEEAFDRIIAKLVSWHGITKRDDAWHALNKAKALYCADPATTPEVETERFESTFERDVRRRVDEFAQKHRLGVFIT